MWDDDDDDVWGWYEYYVDIDMWGWYDDIQESVLGIDDAKEKSMEKEGGVEGL